MTYIKNNQLRDCYTIEKGLTLFHGIRKQKIFKAFVDLLRILFREPRSSDKIQGAYHHLCALLLERSFSYQGYGDLWQDYLIDYILEDENPATLFLEKYSLQEMGGSLRRAFERDLFILQSLYHVKGIHLQEIVQRLLNREDIPCWEDAIPLPEEDSKPETESIRKLFFESADWRTLLPHLSSFFRESGAGLFNKYYAFSWERGELLGIKCPDPITFDDLMGNEEQESALLKNTEKLLKGLPSSNALLYGDRGTGKSSTVKALLHRFGPKGLRLIEIKAHDVTQLGKLYRLLGDRGLYYILFIDDLSFNENDVTFRELKALLEGKLESMPLHIRIYATSNLRHLVQESFADRENGDQVHPGDIFQEKVSLAERFGLTLVFSKPPMKTYLDMVQGMALQGSILMEREDLKEEALTWSRKFSTPNGRTARQFIDFLLGEQGLDGERDVT